MAKIGVTANMDESRIIIENDIVTGNIYDKYENGNPIVRYLMKRFFQDLDLLVSYSRASTIHEVGCGEGKLSIELAKKYKTIFASDFSTQIISKARRNAEKDGVQIQFKVRNIYDLISPEDSAELIICCEVLEHLKDPGLALKILAKLANPYLIVSVPKEPLWRILNIIRGSYLTSLGNPAGHIQHWSKIEVLNMLSFDFDIVKTLTPFPWIMVLCRTRNKIFA